MLLYVRINIIRSSIEEGKMLAIDWLPKIVGDGGTARHPP